MSCLTFGKWLLTISLFPILSVNDMTVLFILIAVYLGSYRKIGRGYAGAMMFIPAILGAILLNALPQHKKIGLLFSYWLTSALCCLDECSSIRMPLFSRRYLSFCGCLGMDWITCCRSHKEWVVWQTSWLDLTSCSQETTVNAILLVAYGIGNAAGPFMWKKKYQPR